MTSEYFRLGLSITCFLGPAACRAKGNLQSTQEGRDIEKKGILKKFVLCIGQPHLNLLSTWNFLADSPTAKARRTGLHQGKAPGENVEKGLVGSRRPLSQLA